MGAEFTNLTEEDMCDLMCGDAEEDAEETDSDYEMKYDNEVSHPTYYADTCSIECIESMLVCFGVQAVYNFCVCNAYKYIWRHKNKNGVQDLHKAQWYVDKAKELYDTYSSDASVTFDVYSREEVTLLEDLVNHKLYGED